ncbi:TerB N-terminal domain-containing protein [Hyphomonas sp.]|uniref:TerB N-terminal domain-containing protein n=1 Tax=Hyphomonas sp. TaxID=87 RepID=UPI003265CABD
MSIGVMVDSLFSLRINFLLAAKDPMPKIPFRYLSFACIAVIGLSFVLLPSHAQSADVEAVQTFLREEGYSSGVADGFMGPRTQSAIQAFQADQGIEITGEIDPETLEAIKNFQQPPPPITPSAPLEPAASRNQNWLVWGVAALAIVFLIRAIGKKRHPEPELKGTTPINSKSPKTPADAAPLTVSVKADLLAPTPARSTEPSVRSGRSGKNPWVPQSESATVGGRKLGGMVYVGPAPKLGRYDEFCRAFIDPSLAVSRIGNDFEGTGMSYWPGYRSITATSRATYLDWLASDRSDPRYNVGYMFLYFYGLERRFFIDKPSPNERQEILAEVRRLKGAYGDNYSARNYLSRFIDAASVSSRTEAEIDPVFENDYYELPLSLRLVLGTKVGNNEALSADWMLSWLMCHPERHLRTPAIRCWEEFRTLFQIKFDIAHPGGMKVRTPKRTLKSSYSAASGEFEVELPITVNGREVPDISTLRAPVNEAQTFATAAMDELDKYSRYLGRNPDGRGTLEAQALLPSSLWLHFPSTELEELKAWAAALVESGGLVPALDMIERLEGDRPEKIGKRHLTGAADALARIGFGLAPDPRYGLRSPRNEDPVMIFKLPKGLTELETVSNGYRRALTEIALGAFIAQADGEVVPAEYSALEASARNAADLTASEKIRLLANLNWLLAVPPDMSLLRRQVKESTDKDRDAFRQIALAMASADAVIQPEEVGGVEKIYRALGLDVSTVYSDLHTATMSNGLIPVRPAQEAVAGERIPEQGQSPNKSKVELDFDRISATQKQTADVSELLGRIFATDEAEDDPDEAPDEPIHDGLGGLDPKLSAFVRVLLDREFWSEADYAELCQRFGLMESGSLETINEWAIGRFDDSLIEAYEGYEMNAEIVEKLKE